MHPVLTIAVCLLAVGSATTLRAATAVPPAPAFELITFAGESYSNVSTKGRPMLLVFWAPWCNVCQRELPQLTEFYQPDKPKELDVVSIGFADTRTTSNNSSRSGLERSSIQRHTMKIAGWRRLLKSTPLQPTCYWMLKGASYWSIEEEAFSRTLGFVSFCHISRDRDRNSVCLRSAFRDSGARNGNHPKPQHDINASAERRPPGRDARILNENIMHKIKETVCSNSYTH